MNEYEEIIIELSRILAKQQDYDEVIYPKILVLLNYVKDKQ